MPSINDVAKLAGVSISTVSRTFSVPASISSVTQQRVLEAARSLNYRPRPTRTAATRQPRPGGPNRTAIGFQFFAATPDDTLACNTFYAPILSGVQAEANTLGWNVLVHTTDRHSFAQEMPRMIEEGAIGGLLLVGTADPEVLSAFAKRVSPLVLVDNYDDTTTYDCVLSDGFGGAYAATNHLIALGHRRIAFVAVEDGAPTFCERRRGYLCAMIEAGLPFGLDLLFTIDENDLPRTEVPLAESLRRSGSGPTAIVAANDRIGIHSTRICRRAGLRVPEDVSIVGFDDVLESLHSDPPLTTVRVDKEALGRVAVRRLQARLEEAERPGALPLPIGRHELPVSLVLRESTAKRPFSAV